MILEREIAELIIELQPKTYKNYIWYNLRGRPMIYIQLKKGIIWDITGSNTILETVIQHIAGVGFQHQ